MQLLIDIMLGFDSMVEMRNFSCELVTLLLIRVIFALTFVILLAFLDDSDELFLLFVDLHLPL